MKLISKIIRLPILGRFGIVHEKAGFGAAKGFMNFSTEVNVRVIRNGKAIEAKHLLGFWARLIRGIKANDTVMKLGSGLVTNVGVMSMIYDFNRSSTLNLATLNLANQHMTGTGTTVAAATDIGLQTISTNGGQTAVAGTQSAVTAANVQKYHTVARIPYTGSEAVTEWGLHSSSAASSSTGSPLTAVSGLTVTVTGAPLTASSNTVRGLQGMILVDATAGVYGLILSNTTSQITVAAWYKISDGTAGSAPGTTDAFVVKPVMWDHKIFPAYNVISGDQIEIDYLLTVTSGG